MKRINIQEAVGLWAKHGAKPVAGDYFAEYEDGTKHACLVGILTYDVSGDAEAAALDYMDVLADEGYHLSYIAGLDHGFTTGDTYFTYNDELRDGFQDGVAVRRIVLGDDDDTIEAE